jgi:hypothetical protein
MRFIQMKGGQYRQDDGRIQTNRKIY